MGASSSSSLFGRETSNTTQFTVPVPYNIFTKVTRWEEQRHGGDADADVRDALVSRYVDFLNRCDQIGEIVDKGRQKGTSYFSVLFQTCVQLMWPEKLPRELQKVYKLLVDTTSIETSSLDPFEHEDAWISRFQQQRYENAQRHYASFLSEFEVAVETQKDTFFVVLTRLFNLVPNTNTHATVTLVHLKFAEGGRCGVNVVILDPHGLADTDRMASHENAWMRFLKTFEKQNHTTFTAKTFSKPYTNGGLQRREPICTQWALILGLTYVMNMHVTRDGNDDACFSAIPDEQLFIVMDIMARHRKRIMTAFMFWIHLISGLLFQLIDDYDDDDVTNERLLGFISLTRDTLINVPSSIWPQVTIPLAQRRTTKLTSDPKTCVFDVYNCDEHLSQRDCTSPCQWRHSTCYNPHFFPPPPPPPPPPESLLVAVAAAALPPPPADYLGSLTTSVTPASGAAAAAMAAMIAAASTPTPMVKKRKTR